MEKRLELVSRFNEVLVGLEAVPRRSNGKAVILVHGFAVDKHELGLFDDLNDFFTSHDFHVFRFDFSGCGESEGDYRETSISKLKSELQSIIEFVSDRGFAMNEICIVSQSFGTSVVASLAPDVGAAVFMGTIARPGEIIAGLFGEGYNPGGVSKRTSRGKTVFLEHPFWKDAEKHNLEESMNGFRNALFIHGENDEKTPIDEAERLYKRAGWPKKLVFLRGASHSLKPKRSEVKREILSWFRRHVCESGCCKIRK